jgi:hypothetical protein
VIYYLVTGDSGAQIVADSLMLKDTSALTPSCHPNGFVAIDELAQKMRVKLIVHGHHHTSYEDRTIDGIAVRGLAQAEPWLLEKR